MVDKQATPWWVSEGEEQTRMRLIEAARVAWTEDTTRRLRHRNNFMIWSNRSIAGLSPEGYYNYNPSVRQKIRLQIVRTMIDAIGARIATNKPKPTAITKRGSFTLRQQAKKLDYYLQGIFSREKAYILGRECFRDGMVFADGLCKVSGIAEKVNGKLVGRVAFERVPPWEVFCDKLEGFYNGPSTGPRNLYQIHSVDRGVLMQLFPDDAEKIRKAPAEPIVDYHSGFNRHAKLLNDRVDIVEAWHLPSGRGAGDGRHILAMGKLTLNDTEWKHNRFPFAHIRWAGRMPCGYWSQSLCETSESVQREVNELAGKIQIAQYYNSRPVMLVEEGSDVDETEIDNDERGIIVRYRGTAPQFHAPQVLSNEVYGYLQSLMVWARELEGVNELTVSGTKPPGLQSGKALLDLNDITSQRFLDRGQAYEEFFLDLGALALLVSADLHEAGAAVEVHSKVTRFRRSYIDTIKWGEVSTLVEDDHFELTMMPASSLPQTPAGRRQAVESMYEVGFITREQALELMELPDIEAVLSRELSAIELPLFQLESILEDKKMVAPIPQQDLPSTLKAAQAAFMRGIIDDIGEERLDLLNQFAQAVQQLIDKAKQAALEEAQAMAQASQPQMPMQPEAGVEGAIEGAAQEMGPQAAGLLDESAQMPAETM